MKRFPTTLKLWLEALERTPQSTKWHPEGNCLIHTRIVTNRAIKTNDLRLIITALFHDLGKAVTTTKNKHGNWSAHGHEKESMKVVEECRDWIEEQGVSADDVMWLVENHMRVKHFDEMSPKKQRKLEQHPLFPALLRFTECDTAATQTFEEVFEAGGLLAALRFQFVMLFK
jgi:hypothetical protein